MLVESGVHVTNAGRHPCKIPGVSNLLVPALTIEHLGAVLPARSHFDGMIHLAAAGVNPGDRDRHAIFDVNATLAPQIVSLAAALGVKAVVMVGSSAEYSAAREAQPLTEDAPLETQKIYGASKAAGGILALASGAGEALPVGVLRLFNVFGPGEAAHRLLPALARSLANEQPVRLSPGTQIRDFVHVDDVCAGLIAALRALSDGRMVSGAYNLATGNGVAVGEFARTVAASMNADPALLQFGALPFRPDDLHYVVGNPSRLRAACGWSPRISLVAGIANTLAEL